MDETYIKLNGKWVYLYRAVDKEGNTIDFLLRSKRDAIAAKAFFRKAFKENGRPDKVTIDKSGSNKAALDALNKNPERSIKLASPLSVRGEPKKYKFNNVRNLYHNLIENEDFYGKKSMSTRFCRICLSIRVENFTPNRVENLPPP
jgi:transposase-like protein